MKKKGARILDKDKLFAKFVGSDVKTLYRIIANPHFRRISLALEVISRYSDATAVEGENNAMAFYRTKHICCEMKNSSSSLPLSMKISPTLNAATMVFLTACNLSKLRKNFLISSLTSSKTIDFFL